MIYSAWHHITRYLSLITRPVSGNCGICFAVILSMFLIREFALMLSFGFTALNLTTLITEYLPTYLLISYSICLIAHLLAKVWRPLLFLSFGVFISLIVILSLTDSFLFRFFSNGINAYIIHILSNTNASESSEFIHTYFSSTRFFSLIASYALLICAIIGAGMLYIRFAPVRLRLAVARSAALILAVALPLSPFQFSNFSDDALSRKITSNTSDVVIPTFLNRLYCSADEYFSLDNIANKCYSVNRNIVAERSHHGSSPDIILCIGESFNRHHSSLYGYTLLTNPRLAKRSPDNLFVFTNVITSINNTSSSFNNFLSFASSDDKYEWYEKPLFPAVFKAAGYNVSFFSNQFLAGISKENNMFDIICSYFLNSDSTSVQQFSHRNNFKCTYDGDFVDAWRRARPSLERDSLNLSIIHLLGQHVSYKMRYPPCFDFFKPNDIIRDDLDDKQKAIVAQYDNATRYNDFVLDKIIDIYNHRDAIIIFFADHGDEAFDFRDHFGRAFDYDAGMNACAHAQLDIPFLIFVTDKFKVSHPLIVDRIKAATERPFMTDDLPHLLIDIAGINFSLFNPKRSLINPRFSPRNRIIRFSGPPFNYDSAPSSPTSKL